MGSGEGGERKEGGEVNIVWKEGGWVKGGGGEGEGGG